MYSSYQPHSRWISIPFSINRVIPFLSGRPIFCPCLRMELRQAKWRCGLTMQRTKILPRVIWEFIAFVYKLWPVLLIFSDITSFSVCSFHCRFVEDATALDIWVLEQLRTLFHNATMDLPLNSQLRSEKVVFFLHLLGLDTTGHSYRPHSEVIMRNHLPITGSLIVIQEYMNNIKVVDSIVRQTEALFSEFYRDDETSFIFTADHGMSTIGNHGDGGETSRSFLSSPKRRNFADPDNTRTPLVAWGKGIRGPLPDSTPSSHDSSSEQWGLSHLLRRDVEQADIASLMAALIGINWPVNSVGVLPDVHPTRPGYLLPSKGDQTLASAAFVNAKVNRWRSGRFIQITKLSQRLFSNIIDSNMVRRNYRMSSISYAHPSWLEQKKARTLFYKPFTELEGVGVTKNPPRLMKTAEIEQSIHDEEWHTARKMSAEIIQSALRGLNYLQTWAVIRYCHPYIDPPPQVRSFINPFYCHYCIHWMGCLCFPLYLPSSWHSWPKECIHHAHRHYHSRTICFVFILDFIRTSKVAMDVLPLHLVPLLLLATISSADYTSFPRLASVEKSCFCLR